MRKKTSLLEDTLFQILIAAITETLAKLANLKTAGFYQEAQDAIEHDLEELLGLKADLVRRLSDEHIIEMLTINEVLDVGRLHYVAELFREEGEIQKLQGKTMQGRASQIRALNLFLEVAFATRDLHSGISERIDALFESLKDFLPEETLFTLFDYFEQQGAFAKAESAVNQMLVVTHQNPEIIFEKQKFYRRLLKKSDAEIEAGGLTRLEIQKTP
jgi:hypothetical protein